MREWFAHKLRVRYAEVDVQGVVFNAHYLAYFDINMTELFRAALGGYGNMLDRGVDLVVVDAKLQFRGSARFDDELTLEVRVGRLGNTSITTDHRILRGQELLIEGTLTHVFVDRETLGKIAIPQWARAGLAPWLLAS